MDPAITAMQEKFMTAYHPGVSVTASALPWTVIIQAILSLLQGCTAAQLKRRAGMPFFRWALNTRINGALYYVQPMIEIEAVEEQGAAVMKTIDASTEAEIDAFRAAAKAAYPGVPA